ncbi:MAG: hypothetical protein ABW036_11970 [Flavitalea sp.]
MSKRLENFIDKNRSEFDDATPPPALWTKIEKNLPVAQKKTTARILDMKRLVAAAAVLVAIAAGTWFITVRSGKQDLASNTEGHQNTIPDSITERKLLDEINPGYAKEVYHFTQLIEIKQNELKQIGKDQPELYKQFMQDINHLDSSYNALQKELPANPNREQLLEAMIQNLQLQTELLNQQLRVIKQIKQSKNGTNESNSKII